MTDRYFDQMGAHFARKIYSGLKGAVRLAVLKRDLEEWLPCVCEPGQSLRVLDVGAGLGHMSEWAMLQGHRVTLADPSAEMLDAARERLDALDCAYPAEYLHCPLQDLPARGETFDLVICHAVLEWLEDPATAIRILRQLCAPGGRVSLAFYNRDALVYKNLIKGQLRKLAKNRLAGSKRSLTPQQPLDPAIMAEWVEHGGFTCEGKSGIRVFYDYMPIEFQTQLQAEEVVTQELHYSRHPTYRDLGRYLHWWLRPLE